MVHECPHCGSHTITCRHCSWTWNPRDPENIPDTCPRCRNKWDVPFKWTVKSEKYGHGTVDPKLYALARESMEEYLKTSRKVKSKRLTDAEESEISV